MASPIDTLKKNYADEGILAGSTHFRALWARDALFACFGSLAAGDLAVVKRTLTTLLANLDEGHVPMRVGYQHQIRKYLHLPAGHGAVHREDKTNNLPIDANALLLIIAEKYEQRTHDKLDRERLRAVAQWLIRCERDHVLVETACSTWEDSLVLSGSRLYANVCYYRALLAASKLLQDQSYASRAIQTKLAIRRWWTGTHFTDGSDRGVRMTCGNLLAILWGIADPTQSKTILAAIATRETVCPPAAAALTKSAECHWQLRLIGLTQYHGTMEWSFLAALEIACYRALHNESEALKKEQALAELISRFGGLFEVYDHDVPVSKFFYKSEKDFSWALGLLTASRPSSASILR